ncbi:TadE family type IV pilus minor pilin [Salana multivorans]|uniref:TadE family type IV pilus minor pilin n=1 Tax=Salana multivorans TaxID=120377 RepID=UPI002491AEDF|nr:TadE family type IV pilus minor pilin [Salana multivorans]
MSPGTSPVIRGLDRRVRRGSRDRRDGRDGRSRWAQRARGTRDLGPSEQSECLSPRGPFGRCRRRAGGDRRHWYAWRRWRPPGERPDRFGRAERGSVTAELAVTLPGVMVLLVAVLLAGVVGSAQVAVQDAARVVARALVIGDESGTRDGGLMPAAGVDAVGVTREGEWVHVVVTREIGVLGVGITVTGRASVLAEPTGRSP